MKSTLKIFTWFVMSALTQGCFNESTSNLSNEQVSASEHGYVFDSSEISEKPGTDLPLDRLQITHFDNDHIGNALLRLTDANWSLTKQRGSTEFFESSTFTLQKNTQEGTIVALLKSPSGDAIDIDPSVLEEDAKIRLQEFGIPETEIFAIRQKKLLSNSLAEGETPDPTELKSYKTFVFRGFNGVRVQGDRAVLTYGKDGVFRKALIGWNPLAQSGHKLSTQLSSDEIVSRAATRLAEHGVTNERPVKLRWQYVPTLLSTGESVLTLYAAARVPGGQGAESSENEEVMIDVNAE